MRVFDTQIPDVKIIEPTVYEDERGYFFEAYNAQKFEELMGFCPNFCQSNESFSKKGVIRGLHIQREPFAQSKLVRAVTGIAIDVVVDCRTDSPSFGTHTIVQLSASNKLQVWVPRGCAHGFQALSDHCLLSYQVDAPYRPDYQISINAFDKDLGIVWRDPGDLHMSDKDKNAINFSNLSDQLYSWSARRSV